ncbi:MAG TPA: alpha/beta hydrolase-fold protein [Acidobacteriaceae bacterium]|jgi:enterochelin esterase family protein|nr:alpha/beta hydrolase-fold protein [Acidobacteriaceae bacterium]
MRLPLASFALALSLTAANAQTPVGPSKPPITSVNPDSSITFRYQNMGATKVTVETDAAMNPLPMQRDEKGLWTASTGPLPPEHYGYIFVVDGVQQLDPLNRNVWPLLVGFGSTILVPGHPPAPWELTSIPHGELTQHTFTTSIATHLAMNQERYIVYTPPGYDPKRKGGYPILYLLHGWSNDETGWTDIGQANLILDSLLATGRILPMIVVMPLGYGDFNFVTTGASVWNDPAAVDDNLNRYSHMLLDEIYPAVEREYNVARGRDKHAIAGLSMGGLESLTIGINHPGQFGWVGGFSAALKGVDLEKHMMDAKNARDLRLLWVSCGTSDSLLPPNREFIAWAKSKKLPVTPVETAGKHTWLVWRQNLLAFAPLLFR